MALCCGKMRSSVLLLLCYRARAKRAGQEEDFHQKPTGAARGGRRFAGAESWLARDPNAHIALGNTLVPHGFVFLTERRL